MPVSSSVSPISRRVWFTLALLFAASFLNYLDRQTLSVLKPTIKAEFGLDDSGYAVLVNVFTFCYAGAYIGSGWVVDRIGTRLSLTLFMVAWSAATIGCGFASTLGLFTVFRALLGVSEPGNFPASMRAAALWYPLDRRAFLMSIGGAGGTLGAIAAPPLIAWLATTYSWRVAFVVPGALGLVLAAVWWGYYRDPAATAGGREVEATVSREAPAAALTWPQLWRQRSTWGIVLARFVSDPVWYFCLFWMPGYFQEQKGLSLEQAGRVGWIPFLAANLGALACAAFSDRLGRRLGDPLRARKRLLIAASLLGPLAIAIPHVPHLAATVLLLSIVGIICLTWLQLLGPILADSFPAGNVASVWAIAGAFGATGAMIFNFSIGRVSTVLGGERLFLIMGCLHPIAALLLVMLVRKVQPTPR